MNEVAWSEYIASSSLNAGIITSLSIRTATSKDGDIYPSNQQNLEK